METKPIYKTAEELGIKQWEHDGLVALVGLMRRNELEIDMKRSGSCGSVKCVGGWIATHANLDPCEYVRFSKQYDGRCSRSLVALYFPGHNMFDDTGNLTHPAWCASALQAAQAIINFLTLGDPKWDDVMRGT